MTITTTMTTPMLACPAPMPGRTVRHWIRHPTNDNPGALIQLPSHYYALACGQSFAAVPQGWARQVDAEAQEAS